MKKFLFLGCLVIMAGCIGKKQPIRIGLAVPLTGPIAGYGEMVKGGVDIMVEEINAKGGINGRKVEIIPADDLCDPKEAASVAQRFTSDKNILAVVGHLCSSASLAAKSIYQRAGLVAVSPCSTNVDVCKGSPYMFRTVYRDDFQGIFNARYLKEIGFGSVAVLYDNDDYGIGLKDAFIGEAKAIGLSIVGEEAYTKETQDFTPQLTKIKQEGAKALFIAGLYNEGAIITSQSRKMGFSVQITGADGIATPGFIEVSGTQSAEGAIASTPYAFGNEGEDLAADKFAKDFKQLTGKDPDWMSATAYDAIGVILTAIKNRAGTREEIREYLALMNEEAKGYGGLTGITYFDENGDCQKPACAVVVKDGKWIRAEKQLK